MATVIHRDPPHKCHVISEKVDDQTVNTECGLELRQPNGSILTFETGSHTYSPPVKAGRCKKCPWEKALSD